MSKTTKFMHSFIGDGSQWSHGAGNTLTKASTSTHIDDRLSSGNLTILAGESAMLSCKIYNLGNKSVGGFVSFNGIKQMSISLNLNSYMKFMQDSLENLLNNMNPMLQRNALLSLIYILSINCFLYYSFSRLLY